MLNKEEALQYLNFSRNLGAGQITQSCVMALGVESGHPWQALASAMQNTRPERREWYRSGFLNYLIKKHNVNVHTLGSLVAGYS